jgi:hypothetical protein
VRANPLRVDFELLDQWASLHSRRRWGRSFSGRSLVEVALRPIRPENLPITAKPTDWRLADDR